MVNQANNVSGIDQRFLYLPKRAIDHELVQQNLVAERYDGFDDLSDRHIGALAFAAADYSYPKAAAQVGFSSALQTFKTIRNKLGAANTVQAVYMGLYKGGEPFADMALPGPGTACRPLTLLEWRSVCLGALGLTAEKSAIVLGYKDKDKGRDIVHAARKRAYLSLEVDGLPAVLTRVFQSPNRLWVSRSQPPLASSVASKPPIAVRANYV